MLRHSEGRRVAIDRRRVCVQQLHEQQRQRQQHQQQQFEQQQLLQQQELDQQRRFREQAGLRAREEQRLHAERLRQEQLHPQLLQQQELPDVSAHLVRVQQGMGSNFRASTGLSTGMGDSKNLSVHTNSHLGGLSGKETFLGGGVAELCEVDGVGETGMSGMAGISGVGNFSAVGGRNASGIQGIQQQGFPNQPPLVAGKRNQQHVSPSEPRTPEPEPRKLHPGARNPNPES